MKIARLLQIEALVLCVCVWVAFLGTLANEASGRMDLGQYLHWVARLTIFFFAFGQFLILAGALRKDA